MTGFSDNYSNMNRLWCVIYTLSPQRRIIMYAHVTVQVRVQLPDIPFVVTNTNTTWITHKYPERCTLWVRIKPKPSVKWVLGARGRRKKPRPKTSFHCEHFQTISRFIPVLVDCRQTHVLSIVYKIYIDRGTGTRLYR